MNSDIECKKSVVHRFDDVTDNSLSEIGVKSILRKTTGELKAIMMHTGHFLDITTQPFDIYIHVIEGQLESIINGKMMFVNSGEFVVIPAHAKHSSKTLQPTKLLQLIIKSGYEEAL